jgi:hypothetical protein
MANNPNENDPKPIPDSAHIPPLPEADDKKKLEDLQELDLNDLELLPDAVEELEPQPPSGELSFNLPPAHGDPASFTAGVSLEELANLPDAAGLSKIFPSAEPASGEVALGNLEPIQPVAPASGWLDPDEPPTPVNTDSGVAAAPLEVHQADLFEAPPQAIESSDIFASRLVPKANAVDQSDVIAATAFAEAAPADTDKPRPSEVALSFDQPPGGSTIHQEDGSGELPVAEEMVEAEELPGDVDLLDSAKLAATPPLPNVKPIVPFDAADFGEDPKFNPDASSILADIGGPRPSTFNDSSAVKIEDPGVDRTFSSNPDAATEFDLYVGEDAVPPELTEAAQAAGSDGGPTDWEDQAGSDLFAEVRTPHEVNLDEDSGSVIPVDTSLEPDDPSLTSAPSSIFSDNKKPPAGSGRSGGSDIGLAGTPPARDEDSSVEFSDHPEAEGESDAFDILHGSENSSSLHPTLPKSTEPDDADAGMVDWNAATPDSEIEATMGFPHANLDAPISGILRRGKHAEPDEEDEPTPSRTPPTKPAKSGKNKPSAKVPDPEDDPSVEIDWLAGSSSEEPVLTGSARAEEDVPPDEVDLDAPSRESTKLKAKSKAKAASVREPAEAKIKKTRPEREEVRRGKGGWVGGTLLGIVLAGGGIAGAYFGGLIPPLEDSTKKPVAMQPGPGPNNPGSVAQVTPADITAALKAGDAAKAKKIAEDLKDTTPAGKALAGEAGLFALVQEHKTDAPIAADNPELKAARENLQALVDDADAAKTAEGEKAAVKATIQLGISHELTGDRASAKKVYEDAKAKFPKFAATFEAALDRLAATAPPGNFDGDTRRLAPADARQLLFAITLLQGDTPAKDDETEAGVFFWKAVNKAAGGKYADAVDEIKKAKVAHIKQAKAMAGRGLNPLSDPLEQIFARCCDDLKAYWELRAAIYANKAVADLVNKDGAEKAMAALAGAQKKADAAIGIMAELKDATAKLTKADTDLKKAQKDLKDELEKFETRKTAFMAAEAQSRKEIDQLTDKNGQLERDKKRELDFIASLAKELQTAKLLSEKFDNAELLAAQKKAAERASGPNLTALVPSATAAIGGTGLSSAQLLDIAERLGKAEAAAKAATAKLTTETARLTAEHVADIKKLMDAHTTATAKLKDDQTAELKKAGEKFVADMKKLSDDFEVKIKDLQTIAAREKERNEAQAAQFKRDLGNAIGPAQALDLWLPLLVELRRPADADPALATATKVIGSAGPNSEDWAKARTVAGLSLLYKGDLVQAKFQFESAKASPAYEPAVKEKKLWATAADVGLASISDPLAPYRSPPELPKRDPVLASHYLDTGIKAFKDGRNADAIAALTDSTKADPTNPLSWYFLGAARWSTGAIDAAKDDFRQGSVREEASTVSTRAISDAISPIQGPARDALTAARP